MIAILNAKLANDKFSGKLLSMEISQAKIVKWNNKLVQ